MNSTDSLLSANDSTSEETNVWNSTGTTDRSSTYGSSDIDWSTYLLSVVQWIIFFVGAVGNIIVLVVLLWRRSRSQVSTQLFVGSLAVADIGLMFSTVWVEAYDELQETWHFGVIPCKLQYMWQWLTMNCSIWTLAALSIDRFLGMDKPSGIGFKVGIAVAVVAYIWIHNVAFNVPMLLWANLHLSRWSGRYSCFPIMDPAYTLAARIINFYVPLVITWTSYIGIIYKLKRSMNKVGVHGSGGTAAGSASSAKQQATRRVTVMCMTIATTFTVAWVPFQMNHLVLAYGNRAHGLMLIDALETMTYVNSCVNPIVYALMWRPFRLSFIQMMDSVKKRCCGKTTDMSVATVSAPTPGATTNA